MDSGARGNSDQIKQLAGIRGIMGKPLKAGSTDTRTDIENPILANFKEGMSVLEYFISTHGARKGLADTALKTADAGYLTRRLVDVSHDVIINEEDCGTLRGLATRAVKDGDRVVASLSQRILGRVSVHDIHDAEGNLIVASGEEIREPQCEAIEAAGIEEVVIRSVLTCESKHGVCAKCYGRNLASRKMVQKGEAVGVIAAQAIGEPGTQLTLRTFHSGGLAGGSAAQSTYDLPREGIVEIEDLRTITTAAGDVIAVSRKNTLSLKDEKTGVVLATFDIPYSSIPLLIEQDGHIRFEDVIEGVTCKTETDEQTGKREVYITESKDKTKLPQAHIIDKDGNILRSYNLPVKANLEVKDGDAVKIGDTLFSMARAKNSGGDITSGLPRITELFEARNPSNPAIVAEIDGEISYGKIKRGNRELFITSKLGEQKAYLIPLTKQILVQEGDFVRAGAPLSDGAITPDDILAIQGPTAVQNHIVNEAQAVYRMQGVEINDKHFEIIVRQMMRKVEILEPGDTRFLEGDIVDKLDFLEENDRIWGRKVVTDAGDSELLHEGQIVTARRLHDENSSLRRRDKKLVQARDAESATAKQILQGITRAALGISAVTSSRLVPVCVSSRRSSFITPKNMPLSRQPERLLKQPSTATNNPKAPCSSPSGALFCLSIWGPLGFFCPLFFFCPPERSPVKREERPPPRRAILPPPKRATLPLSQACGVGGLPLRRYSLYVRAVYSRVPSRYYVARPVRVLLGSSVFIPPDGIRHPVPLGCSSPSLISLPHLLTGF